MNKIDTAQRRAEALLRSLGVLNTAGWEVGKDRRIAYILEYAAQTRRAALEEASKVVNDYNLSHDHGKKATKACDDIFEQLDRLASEGG